MSRIVVPLDGSTRSEQALGTAERLARQLDGHIELVRVVEGGEAPKSSTDEYANQPLRYLEMVAGRFAPDVSVRMQIIEGRDPAAELINFAGSAADTFIVMSTHGHGAIGSLIFGSVAYDIVRHTRVPVVLVRGESPSQAGQIRRIILPLDGSILAEQALPAAATLARRTDATISLVQVIDLAPNPAITDFGPATAMVFETVERSREDARIYLNTVANRLRNNGVRTTWEVRVGVIATEINRAATTTGADLIVMSTHGRTGLRRLALGSVTEEVARHSSTLVMIVPTANARVAETLKPEMSTVSAPE